MADFICMVGLWKMRKWAVFVYIGLVAVHQVVMAERGTWIIYTLLFPAIIIAISLMNLSKMK